MSRLVIAILLSTAFLFTGCKQEAEADKSKKDMPVAVLTAPADATDDRAWQIYAGEVVKRNMDGISERTFNYYLPASSTADFEGLYQRQLEAVQGVVIRTVLPGNMLTFVSPESAKMADLIVAAFTNAGTDSMKGVRILFIGKAEDRDRVAEALKNSNADFVFVEAK